jgi:TolB-like protein/Tfp pilus assembly protein PilF
MNIFQELKRRNVIRVGLAYTLASWLLLQIVDFVLEVIAAPDWILQVFVLAAGVGLPIVLIFSWVFEMTPEGIKRESDIDRGQSITPQTGRKLDRVIIVTLALAVILLLTDRFLMTETAETPGAQETAIGSERTAQGEQSIAVLPFVNMSADPDQEFFSDGISEEILNALTYIPGLKVAARTSSFQFKSQNLDVEEIGRKLGVALLLEGSVRTAGDRVRITVQLIQADDGFHLWSRTYDRLLEDVFAIQDEIAQSIASELQATFAGDRKPRQAQVDLIAYQHYLKARGLVARRTDPDLRQAVTELEAALQIEPAYAPAMALMAKTYLLLPWYSEWLAVGRAREIGRDWAERALELEPDNVEALATLGSIIYQSDLDWKESRRLLERAVALAPANVSANNFLGDFLLRTGDLENALIYERRALELDPLSAVQFTDLANIYAVRGDLDKVSELAAEVRALDAAFFNILNLEFSARALAGDLERAKEILEYTSAQPSVSQARIQSMQLKFLFESGNREAAGKLLATRIEATVAGTGDASHVAVDAVWMGEYDTAASLLQTAVDNNDGIWLFPQVIRLPEQAPDSEPWQSFWSQPRVAELAELRKGHGLRPNPRN